MRYNRIAAAAIAAVGLCALAVTFTPAKAQVPYLGVDLGNGIGVGVGVPPSAYGMAPVSPIAPIAPLFDPYYYPPRPYYYPW